MPHSVAKAAAGGRKRGAKHNHGATDRTEEVAPPPTVPCHTPSHLTFSPMAITKKAYLSMEGGRGGSPSTPFLFSNVLTF